MPPRILEQACTQKSCPSFKKCHNVATAVEPAASTVDVMFISDVPSEDDIKDGRAFASKQTKFLRRIIEDAGGVPTACGFTSLLRCRPVDRDSQARRPDSVEIELCKKHLIRDLDQLRPKVLVFFGLSALRAVVPAHESTRIKYNKVFTVELGGRNYLALSVIKTHEVLNSTSLIPHYQEGIKKAVDLSVEGKKSIYHPSRWRADPAIHYCDTVEKIERMVNHLLHETNKSQTCSFDVETRNLNSRYGNNLVMLQFCIDPFKEVWVVPYAYQHGPFLDEDLVRIKALLKRLFTEKPGFSYWLTHFGVFEQQQVMEFITGGKTFKNVPMVDIMGLTYILDENRVRTQKSIRQGFGLKELSSEYLGRDAYDSNILSEREAGNLHKAEPSLLIPYAAEDVISTSLLFSYLREIAMAQGYWDRALKLASTVFCSGYRVFAKLKRNGIFTDLEHLRMLASKVSPLIDRMNEIKNELRQLPSVRKANEILARRLSGGQKPLWGTPWVFALDTQEHQQVLFFEVLGLKPVPGKKGKKKKTAKHSVNKEFYEKYAGTPQNPVPKPIKEVALMQEYSGFKKLSTGYTRKIIKLVDPNSKEIDHATDCRVRASFGFTDTVTGRPNCTAPNIQNVPRADTPTKASVKSMYCAQQSYGAWRPGKKVERVLMQLDYAAAEVRWWALISGDHVLAEILRNGKFARDEYRKNPTPENKARAEVEGDIHLQTARMMFPDQFAEIDERERDAKKLLKKATTDKEKADLEKILKQCKTERKEFRQHTKAIVFALIYGGGPSLIASRIKKEDDLPYVRQLCMDFADRFQAANKWLRRIERVARDKKFVESPLGRRRRLPEYLIDTEESCFSHLEWAQAAAARLARNAPIQGVASDGCIIGAGMWLDYIEDNNKDWKIVNIVHDSCVTEVPIDEIEEAAKVAERCFTVLMMRKIKELWGVEFICPLEVDFEFGVAWGAMRKVEWTPESWAKMREWLAAGGVEGKA